MSFGNLQLLIAIAACVPILVIAYAFDGQRRRRAAQRIGHLPMIARMTASSSPARRRWRAVLTVTAATLLGVGLARPQIPGRARLTESRGLDLVVALDFSRSMLAHDVYPTRLDRAKAELGHLIDTLKGDRVGLVAFAGETLSYPLTVDYEAAKLFWRDLGPDDMPVGGTDLGRALQASLELLANGKKAADARKGAQVILLITDGEDTEGRGLSQAREAAKAGVRLYTLGIGSNDRPFVPLRGADGKPDGYVIGADGEPVRVGLDEATLKQMSALTQGDYVRLDPQRFGVERVQQAIAGLERTQEEARYEREPEDVGRFFLLPAFLLLVIEACARERRRRVAATGAAAAVRSGGMQRAAILLAVLLPFTTGFDLFLRRDPDVEEGNRQLQAGHADEALKAYDRAAQARPEEPIVRFDRGAALYALGKYPEAQKEFQRAAEGHDASLKADAYYNMGNSMFAQERYKDALEAYKHTLGLRPDDRRAKWNLELALRKLQEQKQQPQQQQDKDKQDDKNKQDDKDKQQQQEKQQQEKQQQEKQQQEKQQQEKQQQEKQQQEKQQQEKQQQEKQQQEKQQQPDKPQPQDKRGETLGKKDKDIDRQDAEAVLDALERVEPTVQKELARRRAGNRRPTKDW